MGRTPRGQTRAKIFRYVRQSLLKGQPPTVREVQNAFGFKAVETARSHLEALVKSGHLTKSRGQARGYRLAHKTPSTPAVLVPLLGRVQAGALTTALEESEGFVLVQTRFAQSELFALRVRGDSMSGAGILPDDVVIVRRQAAADQGDIVVSLVGDEATVKRLRLHSEEIELVPDNPDFQSIFVDPREWTLLGKVVEVRRFLEGSPEDLATN